jgi:uncharacterized protein
VKQNLPTTPVSKQEMLDEGVNNLSNNAHFSDILQKRLSRRDIMRGSLGAAAVGLFGAGLVACDHDAPPMTIDRPTAGGATPPPAAGYNTVAFKEPKLGFKAIPVTRADTVTIAEGYTARPFLALGTPICGSYPAYKPDGSCTGEDQEQQMGMCHDGLHFFPINGSSSHGLLVMNHEYIMPNILLQHGATIDGSGADRKRTVEDEVRKEVAAHGVSIVEIQKNSQGEWQIVPGNYNRRIHGNTPMELTGPVRAHAKVRTKYSPAGTMTRGTLNNCGNGYTPWNTYLTCEENWAGYFVNNDETLPREHSRFGVSRSSNHGRYWWHTIDKDQYSRFDCTTKGASATADYRNEVNGQGWIVEIDPFDPTSTPKKRTAMGRFAHEGAIFAPPVEGKPLVFYSGDDARNEYVYKFVTRKNYHQATANGDMLDDGVLYVARFNDDGTGDWLALDITDPAFLAACVAKGVQFSDQGDVLLNTRLAADTVGATKMDRPEWGTCHPVTGEVYFTLTNNTNRTAEQVDAANPRANNATGHIIRWREMGNESHARSFKWDIFVLSGDENNSAVFADPSRPLTADNIHASPDGLWIDYNGILWIQTDMSGSQQASGPFGNNQMLAAEPTTGEIRRFLQGPHDQEVTGVITTPDSCTMFVNMQHPGDRSARFPTDVTAQAEHKWTSNWPDGGTSRPRCAMVVITRDNGGVIGL